jgi:hypothetical protein
MENDSTYSKSNLTLAGNSKGGSSQGKGGFLKEKKRKWEKAPHNKGKKIPQNKKSNAKVNSRECYNCRLVGHLAKACNKPKR